MSEHECITHSADVAYEWVMQGRILAYPTESVWGLGCHAFDVQAVNKLLALKQRPVEKGVIVLTSDESYIDVFLKICRRLAKITSSKAGRMPMTDGRRVHGCLIFLMELVSLNVCVANMRALPFE